MPEPVPHASTIDYIEILKRSARKQRRDAGTEVRLAPGATQPPLTLACMVTHGMGQQVRFDTCAQIADAFVRGRKPHTLKATRAQLTRGGDLLARMELHYLAHGDQPETFLHIYEGYWAPLTEGKITYYQVVKFLLSSAIDAIPHSFGRFNRWVFNKMHPFPVKPFTFIYLLATALFLLLGLGIIILYGIELARITQQLKQLGSLGFHHAVHQAWKLLLADPWWKLLLFLITALYAYFAKKFLIEYIGDVAIYVSSYKVSVFEEVRNAIQAAVLKVGKQIFLATEPLGEDDGVQRSIAAPDPNSQPSKPVYDQVIFVGHSLGSVITYDLINALIVWDATACEGRHNVVRRIRRFITFGSPLDKTAFLFRTQPTEGHHYREAMAGNMQPLVLDYELRPFHWVNLRSPMDPISGQLAYYDLPAKTPLPPNAGRVRNLRDPAARMPVLAHVQYWKGDLLRRQLISALEGTTPPSS